jgi:hypothetical protein
MKQFHLSIMLKINNSWFKTLSSNHEWIPLYNLAQAIYDANETNIENLKTEFASILKTNNCELLNALELILIDFISNNAISDITSQKFKELDSNIMRFDKWLKINQLFATIGLTRLAFTARLKSTELLKKNSSKNQLELFYRLKLSLEEDDTATFKSLREYFFNKKLSFIPNSEIHGVSRFYNALKGLKLSKTNKYYSLLSNKTIAIVGPTETRQDYSKEIDNFDIVVRTNFINHEKINPKLGTRTDISYYNNLDIKELLSYTNETNLENLKMICYKKSLSKELKSSLKYNSVREMEDFDDYLFNGKLSKIPNILLDIILNSEPKLIKLFNINFQLHNDNYSKNYRSHYKTSFTSLHNRFQTASHDLITQKRIYMLLLQQGLITLDESSLNLLTINDLDYVELHELNSLIKR